MSTQAVDAAEFNGTAAELIQRIVVRVQVGNHRMSGTQDPIFLRIGGPSGREFRLTRKHGHSFRRGAESVFVLGGHDDSECNVAHAELNDPTRPPLPLEGVERVFLVKGNEPIPNVRGYGEMDDRLEVSEIEVALHTRDRPKPLRFRRTGPIWLGLVSGLSIELERVDEQT